MTSVGTGPWSSYEESFKDRLKVALDKADTNPYLKGWWDNGVRERLDAFVENGVAAQFQSLGLKDRKVVVHADFTTNNILYDASSKRITALLDYDFSCISHPSYEFLRSFDSHGGQFVGWTGDTDGEPLALRDSKLHGFPSPLPAPKEGGVDWDTAKAWEEALEKAQLQRPRTIVGIEKVADVDAILRGIMPWRVTNDDMMYMQSEKVIMACKNESEKQMVQMLERLGF